MWWGAQGLRIPPAKHLCISFKTFLVTIRHQANVESSKDFSPEIHGGGLHIISACRGCESPAGLSPSKNWATKRPASSLKELSSPRQPSPRGTA